MNGTEESMRIHRQGCVVAVSILFLIASMFLQDEAMAEADKDVADLAAVSSGDGPVQTADAGTASQQGGNLARGSRKFESLIEVRLNGATQYRLSEIFGKIVNTATGVLEVKRLAENIVPDTPRACWVTWRVKVEDTNPFRLQAGVMKRVRTILDAGGEIDQKGVACRYSTAEVNLLEGIRPGLATSRSVQFVIDPELARDKALGFETSSSGIVRGLTRSYPKQKSSTRGFTGTDKQMRKIIVVEKKSGLNVKDEIAIDESQSIPSVNLKIEFDYDSYRIRPGSYGILYQLGHALNSDALKEKRIIIKGHADSDGSEAYNLNLSVNRANSVKDYLVDYFSIRENKFRIIGYGEALPLVPNTTPENKQLNRRVEIQAQ